MSANISGSGEVTQLDGPAEPDESLTEKNVQEPKMLARFLLRIFRDLSVLKRRWSPRRIDFQDIVSTATDIAPQDLTLEHGLNTGVVWWPVRVVFTTGTIVVPYIYELPTSTANILRLRIYYPSTLTIRIEEAG